MLRLHYIDRKQYLFSNTLQPLLRVPFNEPFHDHAICTCVLINFSHHHHQLDAWMPGYKYGFF